MALRGCHIHAEVCRSDGEEAVALLSAAHYQARGPRQIGWAQSTVIPLQTRGDSQNMRCPVLTLTHRALTRKSPAQLTERQMRLQFQGALHPLSPSAMLKGTGGGDNDKHLPKAVPPKVPQAQKPVIPNSPQHLCIYRLLLRNAKPFSDLIPHAIVWVTALFGGNRGVDSHYPYVPYQMEMRQRDIKLRIFYSYSTLHCTKHIHTFIYTLSP